MNYKRIKKIIFKFDFFENLIAINFVNKIWTISKVPKRGITKKRKAYSESTIRNDAIN